MNRLIILIVVSASIAAVVTADLEGSTGEPPHRLAFHPKPLPFDRAAASESVRPISEVIEEAENKLPPLDPKIAESRWAEIDSWMKCAVSSSCSLGKEGEPREKHFALRDKILSAGEYFLAHSATSAQDVQRSYEAAGRLLSFPEEQVQLLAMRWILQLPRNPATVSLFRNELTDMVDPELAQWTLVELRRHMNTEQEPEALDLVEKFLFEGGIFASREVARSAAILLHEGNRERFNRWIASLPPASAKVRLLKEGIEALPKAKAGV